MSNIIAAEITNADAIHPGYGFFLKIQNFLKYVKNTESNLLELLLK
jgi:acetyl/propionyl-CoA carboxylase alpha subunit